MKLGKAFSDSVTLEEKSTRRLGESRTPAWWLGAGRALLFATILIVAFFILIFQLFTLTILRGHQLRGLADENRTRELIRHAPRGLILDRTGKPLVRNISQYRLVQPCEGQPGLKTCVDRVSQAEGEVMTQEQLPAGAFLETDFAREYLLGSSIAHVVGYTGELSEAELNQDDYILRRYRRGDRVGRMGVEAVFEEKLRGRDGRELVEVDALGKMLRVLGRDREVAGEDVTLSLDASLAAAAAAAFPADGRGAIVVSKPSTGEIMALYSSPSFEPNKFSLGMTHAEYEALSTNPDKPLFNRAIGGVYPPGSTFKIVTALSGLMEGVIKPETTVEDVGVLAIGPFQFPNWYFTQYGKTEGLVDMVKAIQRSNDIFFYKVGEWLGITKLSGWAKKVGIGKPLGIELSGEAGGLMPDPGWKQQRFTSPADLLARSNQWYLGDTYHVAIGQGYLLTTPLQVNAWTNVIANGGKLCRPTIKKVISDKRKVISECKDLGIKKETISLITEGMTRACEPGGTGWPLFNFKVKSTQSKVHSQDKNVSPSPTVDSSLLTPDSAVSVPVACKTGTAEFGPTTASGQAKTHAWFTVFAPVFAPVPKEFVPDTGNQAIKQDQNNLITGEPEISVTVLVEGGGEGSNVAAPIAKKILEEWFGR